MWNCESLPVVVKNIVRERYIPTPPTREGFWKDRSRDHGSFQKRVSLAAQLGGGVSSTTGCLTPEADAAIQAAEQQYYQEQKESYRSIIENI